MRLLSLAPAASLLTLAALLSPCVSGQISMTLVADSLVIDGVDQVTAGTDLTASASAPGGFSATQAVPDSTATITASLNQSADLASFAVDLSGSYTVSTSGFGSMSILTGWTLTLSAPTAFPVTVSLRIPRDRSPLDFCFPFVCSPITTQFTVVPATGPQVVYASGTDCLADDLFVFSPCTTEIDLEVGPTPVTVQLIAEGTSQAQLHWSGPCRCFRSSGGVAIAARVDVRPRSLAEPYGAGCGGTSMSMAPGSFADAASAREVLSIEGAVGDGIALLLLGSTPVSIPFSPGCDLLVSGFFAEAALPLDPNASVSFPVMPPLGVPISLQAVTTDLQTLRFSNGLQL